MRVGPVHLIACALAAAVPFLPRAQAPTVGDTDFPGWPASLDSVPLRPLPLTPRERSFQSGFPGRLGRFTDGHREIVIRWVSAETRRLHSGMDCFRGMGYSVKPGPVETDRAGRRWATFEATRGTERLRVRERIFDDAGEQWTDPSAWYWAATLGRTRGPWWSITVASAEP